MHMTSTAALAAQHSTRWPANNADALITHYDSLRGQVARLRTAREDALVVTGLASVPGVVTHMTTAVLNLDAALVLLTRRMAQIDVRLAELGVANPFRS